MLTDFARLGPLEIWNTTRLQAYLTNVGSPFDNGPEICTCDTLTAAVLGDAPYTTPDGAAPAPWYDAAVPESAEYLGFLPLTIDGVDDSPYGRTTTNVVGGGGVFGAIRPLPRTMTVTGVIIGSTCCGAAYGLHFLTEALATTFRTSNDACGTCDGDTFAMYNCCPDPGLTPAQFNTTHRRTFRRTALMSGPTVTRRRSSGDCSRSSCAAGAELIEVEFVLTAAVPWPWTDRVEVLNVNPPIGGQPGDPCVNWCTTVTLEGNCAADSQPCLHSDCAPAEICTDPLTPVPSPPQPTIPNSSFCVPLAPERMCYLLDLSGRPAWAEDFPTVSIVNNAPNTFRRNLRVTFYAKPDATANCNTYVDTQLCQPVNDFIFTYVPPGGTIVIDGEIGRAFQYCDGVCSPAPYVFSNDNGGPLEVNGLTGDYYCVCIESDPLFPPEAGFGDVDIIIELAGKGY